MHLAVATLLRLLQLYWCSCGSLDISTPPFILRTVFGDSRLVGEKKWNAFLGQTKLCDVKLKKGDVMLWSAESYLPGSLSNQLLLIISVTCRQICAVCLPKCVVYDVSDLSDCWLDNRSI